MANWCYSSYVIDGKRKEVQSLFSKMNNLEKRRRPLVGNDFGNTWLGCLVTKLGGDWQKVYCRGSWSDLFYEGGLLKFNTETAWGPMDEVFKFIKTIYPSLEIYYMAEEDGNGVFITNDAEGHYFRDRYRIEYDCDYEYFTTIEGVLGYVSGVIGKELKSKAAMEAAINDWNDTTEDDDRKIYFIEYEIVADEHL
jgi:hypothetical protein